MTEKRKPPNAGKGRVRGVPNKVTADVRKCVGLFANNLGPEAEGWVRQTAAGIREKGKDGKAGEWIVKPDPGRAATIFFGAIDYHIPRLARQELTGRDGEAIPITFVPADKGL